MFVKVIIFLGLCLTRQVRPTQHLMYAEAPYTPLPSDGSSLVGQSNSQTSPNNQESTEIRTGQNGSVEPGVNETILNGFVGQQGTSNETQNPVDQNSPSVPNYKFIHSETPKYELLQADPVPAFQSETPNTHAMIAGTVVNEFPNNAINSIGSVPVGRSSLPKLWHVGIYSRFYIPYMQICGGTLVTTKAVISAAHCFWSDVEGVLPASNFAVGGGKRYRPWNDIQDNYSQKSDVEALHIPVRYRDSATSYQEDVAVVLLKHEFRTNFAVKPVCVNFDEDFDNEQLQKGNMGTILGWGLTKEDGDPSQVLNYLELPSVDIVECLASADVGFLRYITSDKICAGVTTGKALCRGDSGGGLVFYDAVGPTLVPYLRGVASTAPRNEHRCNAHALAALTHVRSHRAFLRRHIPGLEAECKKHFPHADALRDRYGKHETKSEKQTAGQPVQLICNCFCNNTKPSHDEITFYN